MNRAKESGHLLRFDHVEMHQDGGLRSVSCKLCGRIIKGERPIGDPVTREIVHHRNVKTVFQVQQVAVMPMAGYAEFTIEHQDGSKHVTHLCENCGKREFTPEVLEALYMADVATMVEEAKRAGMPEGDIARVKADLLRRVPKSLRSKMAGE